jgi:hypothetical protein
MANDSTRRSLRTGIDVILTVLTATIAMLLFPGLPELVDGWTAPGVTAATGVILGALLLFFTKIRNALEDHGKIPALLKAPPSPGADPVPSPSGPEPRLPDPGRERGHVDLATVLLVVAVALLLVLVLLVAGKL